MRALLVGLLLCAGCGHRDPMEVGAQVSPANGRTIIDLPKEDIAALREAKSKMDAAEGEYNAQRAIYWDLSRRIEDKYRERPRGDVMCWSSGTSMFGDLCNDAHYEITNDQAHIIKDQR